MEQNYINPLGYLGFLFAFFSLEFSCQMQAQEWRVDSALLERCKWRLLFHLFIVTATLPREVPEPENHFIREMLHAWSLKTSPHPPPPHQSIFNLIFLTWGSYSGQNSGSWGKRRGEKPSPYREEQIESHQGGVPCWAVGKHFLS